MCNNVSLIKCSWFEYDNVFYKFLGGSPYPGIPAKELPDFLSNGYRMDQPQFCPNEV